MKKEKETKIIKDKIWEIFSDGGLTAEETTAILKDILEYIDDMIEALSEDLEE